MLVEKNNKYCIGIIIENC